MLLAIVASVSLTITLVAQAPNTTVKTRLSGEVITGVTVAVSATTLVLIVFLGILCGYLCWYLRKKAKRRRKKENQHIVDQFIAE